MRLLFVCYANICRSPTAEGIMRKLCDESGRNDIEIGSAGINAYSGDAPDFRAVCCAAEYGINISEQRSRPVKTDDFKDFDYILALDEECREFLELRRPTADERYQRAKIENLAAYLVAEEIPNPYGTDGFDAVYQMIDKACHKLFEKL